MDIVVNQPHRVDSMVNKYNILMRYQGRWGIHSRARTKKAAITKAEKLCKLYDYDTKVVKIRKYQIP